MSITPEPTATSSTAEAQADVRAGAAVTLLLAALFLAAVAGVLFYNPKLAAPAEAETWRQAFGDKGVWPIAIWSALAAAAGLLGSMYLFGVGQRPGGNEARALVRPLLVIFFVAVVFLAAIPAYLVMRGSWSFDAVFIWSGATALAAAIAGALLLLDRPESPDPTRFRLTVAAAGGVIGLLCVLLGFALAVQSSKTIMGGPEAWRASPLALVWVALPLIGGLALMFASAQLGRRLERKSQNVRRIVYGLNAVMTGLLLLAVLAVPNVLAYADPFARVTGRPLDWTRDSVNTVSPQLREVLANLRDPVKVMVLLPRDNPESQQMQTLLEHMRTMSGKLSWELVSPLSPANEDTLKKLMSQYALSDPFGVLVVPAEGGESKAHEFVRYRDLIEVQPGGRPGEEPKRAFKGENELRNALVSLTEGKVTVYVTQGHGEPSLDGLPPMMRKGRDPQQGNSLSRLKQALGDRRSMDLRPLTVDAELKKVPDDASVVLVIGPTEPFAPNEAKVLGDYLARRRDGDKVTAGKLILCLPPRRESKVGDRAVLAPTGLEGLLAANNVKLGDDRVLQLGGDPARVVAYTAFPQSTNPIARAFYDTPLGPRPFQFKDVRSVEALQPGGGKNVQPLLVARRRNGTWKETNHTLTASEAEDRLPDDPAKRWQRLSDATVAVTVADSSVPADAAHAGVPGADGSPRMVVFGSSSWLTDAMLGGAEGSLRLDLLTSCMSWLREKASIGETIPVKVRKDYTLGPPKEEPRRLRFLPLGLMVLGVAGLGLGVWVVRRR